jgi:hypothetical protein
LSKFGGIWVDADERANQPLNIISGSFDKFTISFFEDYYSGYYPNNDFVICPKNHPVIEIMWSYINERLDKLPDVDISLSNNDYYQITGPGMWTRILPVCLASELNNNSIDANRYLLISRAAKEIFFSTVHPDYKKDPSRNWRF